MKFDIPDGFAVIPTDAVGAPIGVALYCEDSDQCEEVFNQEVGGGGGAYVVSFWRSSERTKPAPKPSPKPRPAVKTGARHQAED